MNYTEASASPQHSCSETENTEADAESTETEHECLATSCVPSTGDVHTTAACRVLEGMRVTPVTAADLFLPYDPASNHTAGQEVPGDNAI